MSASLKFQVSRVVALAHPEMDESLRTALADHLVEKKLVAFESGGALVADDAIGLRRAAPKVFDHVALLGGRSEPAKAARAHLRESMLTPERETVTRPDGTLQEALAAIPRLPSNASERAKAERSLAVERTLRAFGADDGEAA